MCNLGVFLQPPLAASFAFIYCRPTEEKVTQIY